MTPIHDPQLPKFLPDSSLTPAQHKVLALLADGQSIIDAAAAAGVHRNTVSNWRRALPAFVREATESGGSQSSDYFWAAKTEMAHVPGVDHLRFGFDGATSEQCVINRTADNTERSSLLKSRNIVLNIERDNRESILNAVKENLGLLRTRTGLTRHSRSR